MGKREEALDAALGLFNERGTADVSTNHIASEAGISPGNLYYHFRNKQAVIAALAESMFVRWDLELNLPTDRPPRLADIELLFRRSFSITWDYRFFYRELVALLRQDPDLAKRFHDVRRRGMDDFRQLFDAFASQGLLKPTPRRSIDLISRNIWMVGDFWLLQMELEPTSRTLKRSIEEGIELMLQIMAPYLA